MKIISYHSNLYFDAFQLHVKEIKSKGFDTILFCITETDMLYNLEIFKELREYAENEGLQCWATFWGLTAGEAVCKQCNVYEWLTQISEIGFKNIMIDEPKVGDSIHYIYFDKYKNIDFHLCSSDDTFNKISDEEIREMQVKSFGVSCYHWTKDWNKIYHRTVDISSRLHSLRPNDNFIFIQGFDIPEGYEDLPAIVKETCEANHITNFGFWSFRATQATGTKRPVNHKQIWESVQF